MLVLTFSTWQLPVTEPTLLSGREDSRDPLHHQVFVEKEQCCLRSNSTDSKCRSLAEKAPQETTSRTPHHYIFKLRLLDCYPGG